MVLWRGGTRNVETLSLSFTMRPASRRRSVDLPQPDGPLIMRLSEGIKRRLTSATSTCEDRGTVMFTCSTMTEGSFGFTSKYWRCPRACSSTASWRWCSAMSRRRSWTVENPIRNSPCFNDDEKGSLTYMVDNTNSIRLNTRERITEIIDLIPRGEKLVHVYAQRNKWIGLARIRESLRVPRMKEDRCWYAIVDEIGIHDRWSNDAYYDGVEIAGMRLRPDRCV